MSGTRLARVGGSRSRATSRRQGLDGPRGPLFAFRLSASTWKLCKSALLAGVPPVRWSQSRRKGLTDSGRSRKHQTMPAEVRAVPTACAVQHCGALAGVCGSAGANRVFPMDCLCLAGGRLQLPMGR
jgi:hypothetical protein